MKDRERRGEGRWRNPARSWLTRRAFLRASGLAAGLGSAWLVGCSSNTAPKNATTPTPAIHDVRVGIPGLTVPAGLGVNIHPSPTMRADIMQLAAVGFRVVRLDISWSLVEHQLGTYDFSRYDPIIETLAAYNIRPLCILGYSNALYEHTSAPSGDVVGPHTDEVRQAFARFAAAAAGHFQGRDIYWEVWNEPDYLPFWYPTPLADEYMVLVRLTIPAIRQADPQATIIAPALTGLEPQYRSAWTFLERCLVLGLADLVDALSLHPYRLDPPESVTADYQRLRSLLARWSPQHKDLPLISSEWGYSLTWVSPEQQAAYFVRLSLLNLLNGLPMSIWYEWRDDGANAKQVEENFGLLTRQNQPKPAYHAAQTLISELTGFSLIERVVLPSSADYALLFSMGANRKQVVWTAGQPHPVTLPTNAPSVALTGMTGERRSQATMQGALQLTLTGHPQYVTLAR